MKLNSKIHGLIDYLVVVFLFLSPVLFHLPEKTALFTYVLGGIHFILTIFTNYEFGVIQVIPFSVHGLIELIVSVILFGLAFYFGKLEGSLARNFYIGFSIAVFLTWLVSDYKKVNSVNKL